jgi:hypothetical protein
MERMESVFTELDGTLQFYYSAAILGQINK